MYELLDAEQLQSHVLFIPSASALLIVPNRVSPLKGLKTTMRNSTIYDENIELVNVAYILEDGRDQKKKRQRYR